MMNNRDFPDNFNIDALRQEAIDRCGELAVKLLGNPSRSDRLELRWGRHGSKSLSLKNGVWYDHENAIGGDMIALVMEFEGCTFVEAVDWLRVELAMPAVDEPWRIKLYHPDDDQEDRIAKGRALYAKGKPAGDEGRAYFEGRGLDYLPHIERQLRVVDDWFKERGKVRTLLMPFRDCATHDITGVHRIALDAFYLDGKRMKKSLGVAKGSAMMIGPPADLGPLLTVCEGLETGVGAIMGGINEDGPLWALSGTSMLAGFEPLYPVRRLIIAADNDKAGRSKANQCARLWDLWDRQIVVDIVRPSKSGTDFADEYRRR